ncbi:MAG: DUF72 domain-containing protein [Thaumarchaeota archaeon]|nr:DUF72 domain-containing protein [Nitrososphaerota archaeon]
MARYFVGVSGFSYPGWKGKFYPAGTKSEEFLTYYSRHLGSVEINSSFYASPGEAMVRSWSDRTGEEFRFSIKAPRQITHILKLGKDAPEIAEGLSKTLELLGQRRGPILFQLPPYIKRDLPLLAEFLSRTSGIRSRVFEFRQESWLEESTYRLLERQGAGFCIAETEEMKPRFRVTNGVAYYRLRKDSYDMKSIEKWAERIRETSESSRETLCYLRHDEDGENAMLAQGLAGRLS